MDDIINSLQGLAISKKEYKELNLTEIFKLINIDLDNMKSQLITDFSSVSAEFPAPSPGAPSVPVRA